MELSDRRQSLPPPPDPRHGPPPFPRVAEGTLLLYRLVEVAEDIDLDLAEALLEGTGSRLRLTGERAGFLDLPERPLAVELGDRTIPLENGTEIRCKSLIRLFGMGIASVRFEVPLPLLAGPEVLAGLIRATAESRALETAARAEAATLAGRIAPAIQGPLQSPLFETYAIVLARSLEPGGTAEDVAGADLARILLGEPPSTPLSPRTVENVTLQRFSYTTGDLCVIDWDTAFVVEPSGDRSVADVLELASAQLLELRFYDDLFERELVGVAGMLGRPRIAFGWLFVGKYSRITRRIQHRVVDSVEFIARVENAVRVAGDLYLARIYRAAVERFRIHEWVAEVLRRQEVAARVSGLLHGEANSALGHVLEATVIALILIEIVLAFV